MITYNTGSIIVDRELNLVDVREGYSDYVMNGVKNSFIDNVKPEDRHLVYEMVETLSVKDRANLCFRLLKSNGEYGWVMAGCHKMPKTSTFNIRISFQDISNLEEDISEEEMDFGTGLLNKKAIIDYTKELCLNKKNIVNLCILDIDNFKNINDTRGHAFGDQVLRDVATVIKGILSDGGKAGRIGGDEIMLVIEKAQDRTQLRSLLKPIREGIEALYRDMNGFPLVTVSVGSATFPTYVEDYDSLFNLADRMLYRAKSRGKNRYVMYNPDIHGKIVDGILQEEFNTIQNATPQDKINFILGAIEGLFGKTNECSVSEILMQTVATYALDEVYVFNGDLKASFLGYKRLEKSGFSEAKGTARVVEATSDGLFLDGVDFNNLLNSNGVFVIDSPESQLGTVQTALKIYKEKGIQHAFIYRMKRLSPKSYVLFYTTRELSRKFSQPDITDFTYLGKMIEIALKTR